LEKTRKNFRDKGILGVSAGITRFLIRPFYERKSVVMLSKPAHAEGDTVPLPQGRHDGQGEFYLGAAEDVGGISFIDARWKRTILAYLDAGAEIRLGRLDGEILSYQLSHERFILDLPRRLRIPLRNNQVYFFDVHVAPGYRGQGIARRQMSYFESEMMQWGFTEVISLVEIENQASLRFHEHQGFRVLGSGSYLRLARLKSWKWNGDCPPGIKLPVVTPS